MGELFHQGLALCRVCQLDANAHVGPRRVTAVDKHGAQDDTMDLVGVEQPVNFAVAQGTRVYLHRLLVYCQCQGTAFRQEDHFREVIVLACRASPAHDGATGAHGAAHGWPGAAVLSRSKSG